MAWTDGIEQRVTLNAPLAVVRRAVSDAREFGQWFGFTLDGPFVPGQAVTGTFGGTIDETAIVAHQTRLGLEPSGVRLPRPGSLFCTVATMDSGVP